MLGCDVVGFGIKTRFVQKSTRKRFADVLVRIVVSSILNYLVIIIFYLTVLRLFYFCFMPYNVLFRVIISDLI